MGYNSHYRKRFVIVIIIRRYVFSLKDFNVSNKKYYFGQLFEKANVKEIIFTFDYGRTFDIVCTFRRMISTCVWSTYHFPLHMP